MDRRQSLCAAAAASLFATLVPGIASAQTAGPSKRPLRFIVGYPAAGVADFAARTAVDGLAYGGDYAAVVENRAGAAGNIALEFVARQPANAGMFGVFANSALTTNAFIPQLQSKTVDPFKDLVPVAALADLILVMAAASHLGVSTLEQFLAKARAPGAQLRIGLAGVGTPHHLAALLLERAAGLELTLVPYKGGALMIADAAGGHLDAVITTIPVGGPMVEAGKLRWIAIAQPTTLTSLPGVPSLNEVFKGASIPSWIGVFAPAQTPPETVSAMHSALNTIVNSPSIAAKLRANGLEPLNLTLAETSTRIAEEAHFMKNFLSKIKLDFQT
jgi:tripartite-type tricarboxylate transporter receptor subunit TctC